MRYKVAWVVVGAVFVLGLSEAHASGGGRSHGLPRIKSSSDVFVRGYQMANGTAVKSHMRSHPDGDVFNNWSTRSNVNPDTGKIGTVDPYRVLARSAANENKSSANAPGRPVAVDGMRNDPGETTKVNSQAAFLKPISDDDHADYFLTIILELKASKKLDAAWRRSNELIERFPNTPAADKAKVLLPTIYD